jgi:hypothetical protein
VISCGECRAGVHSIARMHARRFILATLLLATTACKGGKGSGAAADYQHPSPKFKVSIPAGLEKGMIRTEGDDQNMSFTSKDGSREVFLLWAKTGSQSDPQGPYANYGHEDDNKKIIGEGTLPSGSGKWIENDRGRVFIHAVATTKDGYGVLCMASSPPNKLDTELLDACKTLQPY